MIHFFGDSFTYCQGCTTDHEYYQRTYNGTQKTWVELVSEYKQDTYINLGRAGIGNQSIIDIIITQLHMIKEGDTVIIGRADDSRFMVPHVTDNFNGYHNILVGSLIDRSCDSMKEWDLNYYNSLVDYTKYVHVPNETPIIQRFDYLYNSLVEYFNGKNVNVIFWKVNEHLRDNITGGAKYPII